MIQSEKWKTSRHKNQKSPDALLLSMVATKSPRMSTCFPKYWIPSTSISCLLSETNIPGTTGTTGTRNILKNWSDQLRVDLKPSEKIRLKLLPAGNVNLFFAQFLGLCWNQSIERWHDLFEKINISGGWMHFTVVNLKLPASWCFARCAWSTSSFPRLAFG